MGAVVASGAVSRAAAPANCGLRKPPNKPISLAALTKGRSGHAKLDKEFSTWFFRNASAKAIGVTHLVNNFYDTNTLKARWIYPFLSGKAILWALSRNQDDDALRMGNALVVWQQVRKDGALARSFGAFPSTVVADPSKPGGGFKRGNRYYSGDNLVILEALCALYQRTKNPVFLNSATGVGTWLTAVMSAGHTYGVWAQDHGAPMHFVDDKGNFSNHIHVNVEMLWIGALKRLGALSGEKSYCDLADRAWQLYLQGQSMNGSFYDHYDPGWPPQPYSRKGWKGYQHDQVISDNQLRSALALCRMGELDKAKRFYRWMKVDPKGGIPAYIKQSTGKHGFPTDDSVYFDVSSSALHRVLCQYLGERDAAKRDMDFLEKVRHSNGGWHWGVRKSDLKWVNHEQAPVIGLWATADLTERV